MNEICQLLASTVQALYHISIQPEVTPSPANLGTDYSSSVALRLTKELHRGPMEIAHELMAELEKQLAAADALLAGFAVSVSQPGFLNFIAPDAYLGQKIADFGTNFAQNISSDEYSGKTVICEFSDPNPFKVLHVGHLYTSVVGDSIARLFAFAGARVIRANFGGDVGLHVAKTMYVLQRKNPADLRIEDIAECYVEGTRAYDEDEVAHREIAELNKEIYRINAENLHDTPLAELYWRGRELSYEYFNHFYAEIGVKFDKYYPESTVAALGLEKVREGLAQGVYEESNGAVIFDGEPYGLHTRVFINQAGVPTYETKDVGLIFTKWQDYHFDKSVVITGNEQLDYMKVVLKSVEQYAPELVERTTHLTHGLVKLPGNVKMSSRKGNFLRAVDVLEMVRVALDQEYHSTDAKVSLAAVKYAFLKYKMGGDIIFDPAESVKMSGNSGPYLLYSCVRAKKILAKNAGVDATAAGEPSTTDISSPAASADFSTSDPSPSTPLTPYERDLIKKLLEYPQTLREAVAEMAPHKVAGYLYELAQLFSRFYEHCPVTGSAEAAARLRLVQIYLTTMTHGLDLLGIEIPEEM